MQVIQVEHPNIKGYMVNMTVSPVTSLKQYRLTKAQRRAMRRELDHHKESLMESGAAKILGFASSHIYASKPE